MSMNHATLKIIAEISRRVGKIIRRIAKNARMQQSHRSRRKEHEAQTIGRSIASAKRGGSTRGNVEQQYVQHTESMGTNAAYAIESLPYQPRRNGAELTRELDG